MPVKFSCPIKDFNTDKYFDSKEMRKYDLFMQYGLAAGIDAINDSGLEDSTVDKESVGVAIGSGIGGLPNIERLIQLIQSQALEEYLHSLFLQVLLI